MGNVPSKEEFEAGQNIAREQGRQQVREKFDELEQARLARKRQAQAAALEDGEVAESSRRDSGANSTTDGDQAVEREKTIESAVTIRHEPNGSSNDRANERTNGSAAQRATLVEHQKAAERELTAARINSSVEDLLRSWEARKEPRQKERSDKTRLNTSSETTLGSRKKSMEVTDPRSPKRTAPDSGFGDERRLSKKSTRDSVSSPSPPDSSAHSGETRQPPQWYLNLTKKATRSKEESEAEPLLNGLRNQIKKAQGQKRSDIQDAFNEARDRLHKIAFVPVAKQGLRNTRILFNEDGLPQIFDPQFAQGVSWPFDIKADAEELYNKWCRQDFETDLMRGIICGKPSLKSGKEKNDRTSDKLRDDWPRRGANYAGYGKLLNGQWWPTQLTCLRDDAHGSSQAGVSGGSIKKGEGAYSCVMSGGHGYGDDKDNGEQVYYCGTDSNNGEVTDATQLLLNSVGQTVRLIRSHQLQSEWSPVIGFRYDGLYEVQDYKRIDPEGHPRARHRFTLARVPGQDPIRGGDGPERRPTQQEVNAYKKDKRLRGF